MGGRSSGGAGNPLFSRGAFSLCLSGCLLLCCDSSDLDFTAPGGAVTNKGLPGGDLNVEAFQGYFQAVLEAFLFVPRVRDFLHRAHCTATVFGRQSSGMRVKCPALLKHSGEGCAHSE